MEETKVRDNNTKTQLSIAAALFFSPLVQYMLKKNTRDISDQEKNFIHGYIKMGYITLIFWIITITAGVLNYFFVVDILHIIYTVSIFILLALLIISVVSILSDISLLRGTYDEFHPYTVKGKRKDILLTYLPLYNIYLRYELHNFEKPNRRLKESLLLRTLFVIICMTGSIWASTITLIAIIIRIASLMSDIDFLHIKTKQRLNKLFIKNPEEIRAYITWFFRYLGKSFKHLFVPTFAYSLDTEIIQEKQVYQRIIDQKSNKELIREYFLWMGILIWLFFRLKPDFTVWTYYVWLGLLITRYLIMAIQLKHLPHLPIAREIILLFKGIGSIFKKKPTPFTPQQ